MARKIPAPREPKATILGYSRALRRVFDVSSRAIQRELLDTPEFARATEAIRTRRGDDEVDDLEDAIGRVQISFERELSDDVIRDIVERYGEETNAHSLAEFRRQFKGAIGLDLPGQAPHGPEIVRAYARDNVRLIKTVHTQKLERVRALVERSWRAGDRWGTISEKIQAELGKDAMIADRIARDQVQKLNAQLTRDRQVAAGVRRFAWRTSKDARVRSTHRHLEGKIFTWKEGHPTERFPGWPIHCRCYAEPVLEDEEGDFVGPTGDPFDATPFPQGIGFARTSGGPRARPSRAGIPPAPRTRPRARPQAPPEPPASGLLALAARTYREAARRAREAVSGLERGTVSPDQAQASLLELEANVAEAEGLPPDVLDDPDVSGALERLRVLAGRLRRGLRGRL